MVREIAAGHRQEKSVNCSTSCECPQRVESWLFKTCTLVVQPALTRGVYFVVFVLALRDVAHHSGHNDRPLALGGILLTHAHTGHYIGLLQLGKEAADAKSVPVR